MSATDDVIRDLTAALKELRSFHDPQATAKRVLDRDSQVFSLIGLVDDGARAVYYDWPIWTVRITPIREEGVGGLTAQDSVSLHHYGRVETYIEDRGPTDWAWLHPRYEWVFSGDGGGSTDTRAEKLSH